MYPFIRFAYATWKSYRAPKIGLFETHVSHHYCMPWDIDLWLELNNGRTLTLYDLGRVPMAVRTGAAQARKASGVGMVVAGASVRYRKRITMFKRFEMRSRFAGFDDKFLYFEQSMWFEDGTCANQNLVRGAVTRKGKMVPPTELLHHIDPDIATQSLPEWIQAWIDADKIRPWPPERS